MDEAAQYARVHKDTLEEFFKAVKIAAHARRLATALKLALEALEEIHPGNMTPMAEGNWNKTITAIREAMAEQPPCKTGSQCTSKCPQCDEPVPVAKIAQQQPTAWIYKPNMELLWPDEIEVKDPSKHTGYKPLYKSPTASKPLTDEEIKRMAAPLFMSHYWSLCNEFARAIEAAHGIKGDA